MNAPAQLSMFEPEGLEVVHLLEKKLQQAAKLRASAEKLSMCSMHSAALTLNREADRVDGEALVFAILCDLERESGL